MSAFFELSFAHEIMKAGFSPWWNPLLSCGTPLFSQPGLALGYPGTLIAVMLPSPWAEAAFLGCHFALAFAGAQKILARFGSGRFGPWLAPAYAVLTAALG